MHKKTIFITGATSGIGLLMAEACIARGANVYATGRNADALAHLQSLGAHMIQADLTNMHEMDAVIESLPMIDVAILNAGVGTFEVAYNMEATSIDAMIDVNVRAPIQLASRLAARMVEQKSGHLIFIGSQAGKVATKKASVYAASKHAITGFVNGLRMEVQHAGVYVTGIYPGPIDTPFIDKADATNTYKQAMRKFLLQPEVVCDAVMRAIERPVREMNIPRVMALTSKMYAVAPALVEKFGSRFFNKK